MSPALMIRSCRAALLIAFAVLALVQPALAQRNDGGSGRFRDNGFDARARNVAGDFDYYALVLSWSPTHCASPAGQDDETQCLRRDGRRYAFVLHGLWPQYERGFPNDCASGRRPFVPETLIGSMMDIMPSRQLIIHEYRKHGTCSGLQPQGYFDLARRLFAQIRVPERYVNPYETQYVAPDELKRELLRANPGLQSGMAAVVCGNPANRLREVRICFTKAGQLRNCGGNEDQRKLCSAPQMYVPPVRSTAAGAHRGPAPSAPAPMKPQYLPGPR